MKLWQKYYKTEMYSISKKKSTSFNTKTTFYYLFMTELKFLYFVFFNMMIRFKFLKDKLLKVKIFKVKKKVK
jgi:hypothetical protein